jgi:hypothetical protein
MRKLITVTAIAFSAITAHAGNTIYGTSFVSSTVNTAHPDSKTYLTTFADGVNAKFTSAPGSYQLKSQDGVTGVGISGATAGEIDRGETISGTFSKGVQLSNIRLGLLFDGPEYGDVNEVAQITAYWNESNVSTAHVFTLTAKASNLAQWAQGSTILGNATPVLGSHTASAVLGGTGAWDILNPFGNRLITKLSFTSITGIAAASCGTSCKNQSDYTLVSVTAVPEVETYAMMLAGLGLMGTIVRRRKAKQV